MSLVRSDNMFMFPSSEVLYPPTDDIYNDKQKYWMYCVDLLVWHTDSKCRKYLKQLIDRRFMYYDFRLHTKFHLKKFATAKNIDDLLTSSVKRQFKDACSFKLHSIELFMRDSKERYRQVFRSVASKTLDKSKFKLITKVFYTKLVEYKLLTENDCLKVLDMAGDEFNKDKESLLRHYRYLVELSTCFFKVLNPSGSKLVHKYMRELKPFSKN